MKIYLVKASESSHEDYNEWNVKAFLTQDAAQEYISCRDKAFDKNVLKELDDLENTYMHEADILAVGSFGIALQKAYNEIHHKYPHVDLELPLEFNGYTIQEIELEGM